MFFLRSSAVVGLLVFAAALSAQPLDPSLYAGMRWRMIGPFRGGRTVAASGIPSQPNVFYVGANNGGIWKTNDYGRTWAPLFDDQPTGSIGSLAISLSDPNTIYAGSGEGLHRPDLSVGDGVYKSTDGGRTWRHMGLRDAQQIPAILVDPKDPNRVFVASLGHPYGPNAERGVFRSSDGGQTWRKVLYKDENTGAIDLAFDPANSQVLYASLWESREGPWENGAWQGPGSGLFKSTDGGDTWRPLTVGLPTFAEGLGRIGIGIAPGDSNRLYAMVDASPKLGGVYRSDDAGATWRQVNNETRVWGRGSDFAWVRVDPKNADIIYVANTSTYKSVDGGKTFTAIKGAPGGDDYHTIWINPNNPQIILLASDQGATLTVNGGETWSSWYNQPTAQFYHVITDNRFPYWVYGGQQESGSAAVASRGNHGEITFRDWLPVGVEEYGYVAPDPLNPNHIYGGKATRFDWSTGQTQNVAPVALNSEKYRFIRTMPLLFSPVDPHILYLGANVLFRTANGGDAWEVASPDLTRATYDMAPSIGVFSAEAKKQATHRGVIYTIAPSPKDIRTIWAGTDDGLIHVTRDGGKTWRNVTPPALTPWSKVSLMDASHFDVNTAYAAVNRFRLDDLRPHIYSTHDGGRTWQEIVRGLPDDPINVVREDPVRKGLLFAGSERAAYVSFNDGADWQPLRLNMPATSIRDLVIHQNDLVAGTHGRGFWILDDIEPLRQLNAETAHAAAHLFRPELAYRVRRNLNTDTPLPPEEPAGENPPDGAILDYLLSAHSQAPASLEIFDAAGKLVRKYSSADQPEVTFEELSKELDKPLYWVRQPHSLSANPGMHRFVWDLRYAPPLALTHDYPISAVYRDTPREPLGVLAMPGQYTVKLTGGGATYSQPLTVKMDPRVKTTLAGLRRQFTLASAVSAMMNQSYAALEEVKAARKGSNSELDRKLAALEGDGEPRTGRRRRDGAPGSFASINRELAQVYEILEGADAAPTTQAAAAVTELERSLGQLMTQWKALGLRPR